MAKQPHDQNRQSLEEFRAYGHYEYAYQHEQQNEQAASAQPAQKPPKKVRKSGSLFFRVFTLLTILTLGLVLVMRTAFRLEAVCVIGHETRSAQEIINLSGLSYGQNTFSISEEEIAARLEKDHTLILKDVQIKQPNMVYLQVEERYPVAVMEWLGVYYVLDKDGLVMAEYANTDPVPDMPMVKGFRVSNAHKGQFLTVKSELQLEAYSSLIQELYLQNYAAQVEEISLGNPENIYFLTKENITVRVGSPNDLKRKIQAVRTSVSYLRALAEDKGLLDVNVPTDVKYRQD
jgi:cell division protein FtsQ